MSLPDFSMRRLLEAGAHFGHQSHRWNPKMAPYIFGARNNIHIIDLAQTVPLLHQALQDRSPTRWPRAAACCSSAPSARRRTQIADAAKRSRAIFRQLPLARRHADQLEDDLRARSARLRKLDEMLGAGAQGLTKKERLMLSREREKLEKALGGIKDMGGTPDLIFVIDTNKERWRSRRPIASRFPVVAILDTNCDPDGIAYPDSRPMTTPAAPSRSIAISSRAPRSTAFRAARAPRASMSARPRRRSPRRCAAAAAEPERGAGRSISSCSRRRAARRTISPSCTGVGPQIVKKLNEPASSIIGRSPR